MLEWQPTILDLDARKLVLKERRKESYRKLELLRGSLLAPRQAAVAVLKMVATAA